ncbi:tRNA (cmo5U34)-methyltransferase [bioreactor metagenome]|uniref:Methyltransferase family protein n=2 Tax=root TaxID=1 RepID=A0A562JF64_9FIRM|nr:class I SAM-dependent methyltransferase [Sedimentibacter saalensis]TWH81703.1 methyltransferase family protein [Sedimentibacter saalensis]
MENDWEKYYKNSIGICGSMPDFRLIQYLDLVSKGNVLDLGIGEGRNSIPFAVKSFNIDGIDTSDTALSQCKEVFDKQGLNVNLVNCNLKDYNIKQDNYNLIIIANVLNFFNKLNINMIIHGIREGLKEDGILYLSVFSTLEPKYSELNISQKQVEENTFYLEERNSYVHYFTQNEITEYFSDFELICLYEGIEYDISHGNPHYHGGIEFMARKKRIIT